MSTDKLNLTGGWSGEYDDPEVGIVPFFAILEERGQRRPGVIGFTGEFSFGSKVAHPEQIAAPVFGSRMLDAVQFVRLCAGEDGAGAEVHHNGLINKDGTVYRGRWTCGESEGRFNMKRATLQIATENAEHESSTDEHRSPIYALLNERAPDSVDG